MGMKVVFSVARSLTSAGVGTEASCVGTRVSGVGIEALDSLLRFFPGVEAMLTGFMLIAKMFSPWLGIDY